MSATEHFNGLARALHWSMAVLVIAMLFVGVGMVASLTLRPMLLDLHRPLGIAILLLAMVRIINRLLTTTPALPADLPTWQVAGARASHWLLYALLLAMPLVGWAMVSAAGNPVVLWPGFTLPAIAAHDPTIYTVLRNTHTWLARVLFATVLLHLAAALFHAWVRRDGVFSAMARGPSGTQPHANAATDSGSTDA